MNDFLEGEMKIRLKTEERVKNDPKVFDGTELTDNDYEKELDYDYVLSNNWNISIYHVEEVI
jgi:hypothetical protein